MQELRYKKNVMPQRAKLHSRSISASSADSYSSSTCYVQFMFILVFLLLSCLIMH